MSTMAVLCQTLPPSKVVLKTDSMPTKLLAHELFVFWQRGGAFLDGETLIFYGLRTLFS